MDDVVNRLSRELADAMAAAVAALVANGPTTIHGAEAAAVSFPAFWDAVESVAAGAVEMG